MDIVLLALGSLLVAATIMSRIRTSVWWVRVTDFPRLQIAVGLAVTFTLYLMMYGTDRGIDIGFLALVFLAFSYQMFRIYPYLPIAPKQVLLAERADPSRSVRVLVSNVLMTNRRSDDLLRLIDETDPDLILAVETNAWWDEKLRSLDSRYPHTLKVPQENFYGMHLFSRLELVSAEVRYLVESEIPSIKAKVRLRSGEVIEFYGLHPRPPDPGQDTEGRDAEILIAAKEIEAHPSASILAGDLNDVAWSHTTRLFQRIGGMVDPRRGRGMYSTFHAGYPMLRWPLDHVFHESSFVLVRLETLRSIGSDHFPVLAELQYRPRAAEQQEAPEADADDRAEAEEKIAEGHEAAKADA